MRGLAPIAYLAGSMVGLWLVGRLLPEWPWVAVVIAVVALLVYAYLSADLNEDRMNDDLRRRLRDQKTRDHK